MKYLALFLAVIVTLSLSAPSQAESQASGTMTMEFDLSSQADGQNTKLWIPYPLSDTNQIISDISISGDFDESAVYSDQKHSTPMLYASWNKETKGRKLIFSFHVTRQEVIKKDFPVVEAPLVPADYALYLAPTRLGPIDGQVKIQADKIVAGETTVQAKARAIYDWVVENMYRDPTVKGCGLGDVTFLLANHGGKCTDINSVFIALARSAGIPAREIFGVRLGKETVVDVSKWQHCWAEFFLPGYGWVPVDPADVRKMMLKYKLKIDDPKAKEFREYFWGGWDPFRVKVAAGRDLILNPAQQGEPLNTFGYPYAEVDGKALDWLDPAGFQYTITYRQ